MAAGRYEAGHVTNQRAMVRNIPDAVIHPGALHGSQPKQPPAVYFSSVGYSPRRVRGLFFEGIIMTAINRHPIAISQTGRKLQIAATGLMLAAEFADRKEDVRYNDEIIQNHALLASMQRQTRDVDLDPVELHGCSLLVKIEGDSITEVYPADSAIDIKPMMTEGQLFLIRQIMAEEGAEANAQNAQEDADAQMWRQERAA